MVRLQKVLADAGVASRRESEAVIVDGRVEVNGELVNSLPAFVNPRTDRVTVDGKPLTVKAAGPGEKAGRGGAAAGAKGDRIYVMLNKPERTLCATRDETPRELGGRKTVLDLVQHPSGARLYPIGRLDYNARGLVILTNDGMLAERLTHARYGVGRVYRAIVGGVPSDEAIEAIKRRVGKRDEVDEAGNPTGGVKLINSPDETTRGPKSENSVLEITLREGRVDPLDEVLHQSGLHVKRLERVGIGPLRMAGVKSGEWRNLTKDEIASLRVATGLIGAKKPLPPKREGGAPMPQKRGDADKRPEKKIKKKRPALEAGPGLNARPEKKSKPAAPAADAPARELPPLEGEG